MTKFSRLLIGTLVAGIFLTGHSWARVRVDDVNYSDLDSRTGLLTIKLTGELETPPELSFNPSMIQLAVNNAYVWPKIEKKAKVGGEEFDTTLMGYQYSKDLVRVRMILPFPVEKYKNLVKLNVTPQKIEVAFPKEAVQAQTKARDYDESYLNMLLKQKEEREQKREYAAETDNLTRELMNSASTPAATDEVTTSQAAAAAAKVSLEEKKPREEGLPFNRYILKFLGLMGLVLLLFFFLVQVFKKGVLNRSKLGFLNNHQMVSVISNTYIGPKRSLILVKVQNQIFLLGSSESGISLVSEIHDVAGIMKKGEFEMVGKNFDTKFQEASEMDHIERRVKLKEEDVATEESKKFTLENFSVKDRVRFSDQMRKKVKNLKPI